MIELCLRAWLPDALRMGGNAYVINQHFLKPGEGLEYDFATEWQGRPATCSTLRQAYYRVPEGPPGVELPVHAEQMKDPLLPHDEAVGAREFEIIKEFRGKEVVVHIAILASAGLPLSAGSAGGGGAAATGAAGASGPAPQEAARLLKETKPPKAGVPKAKTKPVTPPPPPVPDVDVPPPATAEEVKKKIRVLRGVASNAGGGTAGRGSGRGKDKRRAAHGCR